MTTEMTPHRTSSAGATLDHLSVLVVSRAGGVWGAELRLLDLAERLRSRGVTISVAAAPDGPVAEQTSRRGVPFVPLRLPQHVGLRRDDGSGRRPGPTTLARELSAALRSALRLREVVGPFDLLQSHSMSSHVETALAARLAAKPCVLDVHDLVVPGMGRRVLRVATRLATVTVANSRATASVVGNGTVAVRVVHPGVDTDRFHPGAPDPRLRAALGGEPGVPLVGIVGRVEHHKGLELLVEAMSRLAGAAASARLVVVGSDDLAPGYAERLRATAERALGARVTFTGARDDVPAVLRCLDVLVNASFAEPFGRSILEAQATAIPVIASRAGGAPDIVESGITGLLVDSGDADALQDALTQVVLDTDLRTRLGAAGRRRAVERFGADVAAQTMATVYREAVQAGPHR